MCFRSEAHDRSRDLGCIMDPRQLVQPRSVVVQVLLDIADYTT